MLTEVVSVSFLKMAANDACTGQRNGASNGGIRSTKQSIYTINVNDIVVHGPFGTSGLLTSTYIDGVGSFFKSMSLVTYCPAAMLTSKEKQ